MCRESWNNLRDRDIKRLSFTGFGIRNVLNFIIEHVFSRDYTIKTLSQISDEFLVARNI